MSILLHITTGLCRRQLAVLWHLSRFPLSVRWCTPNSTPAHRRNPDWLRHEVLRLKTRMPRAVVTAFNRLHRWQDLCVAGLGLGR